MLEDDIELVLVRMNELCADVVDYRRVSDYIEDVDVDGDVYEVLVRTRRGNEYGYVYYRMPVWYLVDGGWEADYLEGCRVELGRRAEESRVLRERELRERRLLRELMGRYPDEVRKLL